MSANTPPTIPRCDPGYSYWLENLKYGLQVAYLAPPAVLYCRILYVIWIKHRKIYREHQYFVIYSMDSVVGLLLLLIDIFIARFFVYFPQLCQSASHFFQSHRLIMDVYYPLLNYLHCAQPLIQIFLTTNRASSVLWPVEHNKKWARKLPFIIAFVSLSPILFIWNTIVSTKIIVYYFGGFFIIGVKTISWADVNVFLFVIRSMTVGVTVISTTVMFKGMSKMKNRMKKSEKVLCVASAINSVCFMVPSFFEALAFFSEAYGNSWINFLVQPFAWDVLNVGSPFIMIFVSSQLRRHVFAVFQKKQGSRKPTAHTITLASPN